MFRIHSQSFHKGFVNFDSLFASALAAHAQYASLPSIPGSPRASPPRDCPILRPRAGLPLSFRDELRSHTPHAIPLLAACCWLLHVCVETVQAPFDIGAALKSHISMCCRIHTPLVRRMIAMLINCVAEKTNAHSGTIYSVAFSPDGTKIVSGSADGTIKVWDLGAPEPSNRPSLAKTDACWLIWQARWSC